MTVEHDLTPAELALLMQLTPRGRSAWRWAQAAGDVTVHHPCIEHDGSQITAASGCVRSFATWPPSEQPAPSTAVVRAVFAAERQRHERRQAGARKAVVTRVMRRLGYEPVRIGHAAERGWRPVADTLRGRRNAGVSMRCQRWRAGWQRTCAMPL